MKRFMLFAGFDYYPSGGWNDSIASFGNVEDAQKHYAEHSLASEWGWSHVADLETGEIVWATGGDYSLTKNHSDR